jgi:hypothetical protein
METRNEPKQEKPSKRSFRIEPLEERIAPSQSNFPPGLFPAGNPGHEKGCSNSPGNSPC